MPTFHSSLKPSLMIAALSVTLAACSQVALPPVGTVAYGLDNSGQLVTFGLTNPSSSAVSNVFFMGGAPWCVLVSCPRPPRRSGARR